MEPRDTTRLNIAQLIPRYINSEFPIFQHAEAFPFHAGRMPGPDDSHDRVNAWWLAEASALAYFSGDEIAERAPAGFRVTFFEEHKTHTQGFLMTNQQFGILSFRGTEIGLKSRNQLTDGSVIEDLGDLLGINLDGIEPDSIAGLIRDVLRDLDHEQVRSKGMGRVHEGFLEAAESVYETVRDALPEGLPLWCTGHSLGGAISAIIARMLQRDGQAPRGFYGFGMPAPGNPRFARNFHVPAWRFVHARDLITLLPPEFGLFTDYEPVGRMTFIGRTGDLRDGEYRRSLAEYLGRELRFQFANSVGDLLNPYRKWPGIDLKKSLRLLTDHSPIYYRYHLWNHMISQSGNN